MERIFKDIPEYKGIYQVSNFGDVAKIVNGKKVLIKQHCSHGYNVVSFKGKNYRVNRLVAHVFLGLHLNNTNKFVDHINNVRSDNRVKNLQIVSRKYNSNKDNGSYIGVRYNSYLKKWIARIYQNYNTINLGLFDSKEQAELVYKIKLIQVKNKINILNYE